MLAGRHVGRGAELPVLCGCALQELPYVQLSQPHPLIFIEASYVGMIDQVIGGQLSLRPLSPPQRLRGGAESPNSLSCLGLFSDEPTDDKAWGLLAC